VPPQTPDAASPGALMTKPSRSRLSGADLTFGLLTSDAGGPGRDITLSGEALCWDSAGAACLKHFDQITSVALETVIGEEVMARCDVGFADGQRLKVYFFDGSPAEIVAYRDFVRQFIARLGPKRRSRIAFRHGYHRQTQIARILGSVVALVIILGVVTWSLVFREYYREAGWWLVVPALVFGVVVTASGVRFAASHGQRPFDPEAIPDDALPATLQERRDAKRG
jgi:hypothetical protein